MISKRFNFVERRLAGKKISSPLDSTYPKTFSIKFSGSLFSISDPITEITIVHIHNPTEIEATNLPGSEVNSINVEIIITLGDAKKNTQGSSPNN